MSGSRTVKVGLSEGRKIAVKHPAAAEISILMDGDTFAVTQGDSVFYPPGSKHTVRNTGDTTLALLCFFSTPHYRQEGAYVTYDDEVF